MPKTQAADALHAMKYRSPNEDFKESMSRVSLGLCDGDAHYHKLRDILLEQRFLPGGRIQSAIGSDRQTSAYNCMVSGPVVDSLVGPGSIMRRAEEAAQTMKQGCGIGYDFSTLRPKGELIISQHTAASGPVSFLPIYNSVCQSIASAGHRRGAMMGVLRVDHPDIEEFIRAKQNDTELRGFNLSIGVTQAFMECLANGKEFQLRWGGRNYRTVDPQTLWEKIMRATYNYAEPGVIFIDRINEMNNLWYCEEIAATNPCSEQPLPPFGACLLGSFNLPAYLKRKRIMVAADDRWDFDFDRLRADIPAVVRALDNVVDRSRYPLAEQRAEAYSKRRMGIGVAGLANAGEALGHPYGSPSFLDFEDRVLGLINEHAYLASAALAREKGPFPLYDPERYLAGKFVARLPDHVRDAIKVCGIRNSHLTSIAPTGTISMCADNVSGGIEPVWSYVTKRPINTPDGVMEAEIEDYGASQLGVRGRLATDVTAAEHLAVLSTAQRHVDSAVSKTINMDSSMSWADFKNIYASAYISGCKSCSTFNAHGKRAGLLKKAEPELACSIDAATGARSCE